MEFLDKQSENQYQNMIVRVNQLQNSNSTEHLYAEFSSRRAQENLYQCLETTSLKNVNYKSVTTVVHCMIHTRNWIKIAAKRALTA